MLVMPGIVVFMFTDIWNNIRVPKNGGRKVKIRCRMDDFHKVRPRIAILSPFATVTTTMMRPKKNIFQDEKYCTVSAQPPLLSILLVIPLVVADRAAVTTW